MEEKFIENPSTITDLEQMLEGRFHHQRSQSDTSFCFTTNFNNSFFFDTSDLNIYNHPLSFSLPSPITIDVVPVVTKLDESNKQPQLVGAPFSRHLRSFSADFDFYDDLKFVDDDIDKVAKRSDNERKMGHQWHNNLMDGSSTMPFEENSKMVMMDGLEKAMVIDKLVELYLLDPKRAKRNLVNSESAARSNERMNRYTSELVGKVEKLRTKATNLSGEVTMLQRDTEDMAEKNKKIKMRLEAMRQESQRKEDLSQELKEELQHLREENLVLFLVNLLLASHSAMKRLTNSGQNRPNFRNFNRKK